MDMWTVFTAAEHETWRRQLDKLPRHDVYHEAGYHRAYETDRLARAHAYVAEIGGETLFHPVMVRPIRDVGASPAPIGSFDAETVYGYSGPLATSDDPDFLKEAWAGYDTWCHEQGIVCEFTRFNPMLGNHVFAAPKAKVARDRDTVAIDLRRGVDGLWANYSGNHRNSLRKAQKNGLRCAEATIAQNLARFRRLYEAAMAALNAKDFYRFPDAYYETLSAAFGSRLKLFMVTKDGEDLAAALFLHDGERLHYHLSGTDPAYRHLAPANLLLHEAACWAIGQGLRDFHLGGGRTPAPDDSLLRFKARLSNKRLAQHFGTRVFDRDAYDQLRAAWLDQYRGTEPPRYFQLYRLDPEAEASANDHAAA